MTNSDHMAEQGPLYEYGIRHVQGMVSCFSEGDALERLPGFLAGYEANFRNKFEPFIVRREVGPWVRIHQSNRPGKGSQA